MSPALQANLEVERYIGSYLISQRNPPNKRYQNTTHHHHNHNQQQQNKQKHSTDTEKVQRNFNKYCFPPREHHVAGPARYQMPPVPVEYNNHYGKHPPGNSGWAGVPLISMTSGNRRHKKVPSTTNNQVQKFTSKQPQQIYKGKDSEERVENDGDRSPLTRLAIHTQGAPLIQAGRFNNNNRCRNNNNSHREQSGSGRVYRGGEPVKPNPPVQTKDQPCTNTDSSSVASDESSANSENSLPRIIKPRKRRKKDRKPVTSASSPANLTQNEPQQPSLESTNSFLPIRHEPVEHIKVLEPKYEDKQSEDLTDPLASADEFPLGNLLDDEEDNGSEVSSCTPATLCQCRYCDPSGVIWDVDQRCYSPFLTPPSPTDKFHFNTSMPSTYSRQTPPSPYSFNADLATLLRRSWSDPSPYRPPDAEFRPSSPGLQVSSEIVTSPNGHRDIEIKFYSSSSPPESSKSKFSASVSDRELSERCLVLEE